jgi:transcription initiation factor IIE alpha subunit
MNLNNQPGLICPNCNFKITVSIEQLLYQEKVVCPNCNLVLTIDKNKSKKALNALEKLNSELKKNKKSTE